MMWLQRLPIDLVSRLPVRVQVKLLAAFLTIVGLLIILGAVGLGVLDAANQRTGELIKLQRKIEAYRQVQHDSTSQLYSVATALLSSDEPTLDTALRQLNQFGYRFGYDLDRLEFVAKDEKELLGQVRRTYDEFVGVTTHVVELIRSGRIAEARKVQRVQAGPLSDRIDRLTNALVNKAEAGILDAIEANGGTYRTSQATVIAFAVGSILLALGLGYSISWSIVGPIREIETRLSQIASGDFNKRIQVPNRDELGSLAVNVNQMSAELGHLYEQLEMANRHKSQFLANMSHELRTPLNSILGFSEMLFDGLYGELSDKVRSVLERVHGNGKHLLGLINDVLDLTKIEAGQLTVAVEDYSMASIVKSVVAISESLAGSKGIALSSSIEHGLPKGRGDERRLTQVLPNLVGNAIKFTDKGSVEVGVIAVDGQFNVLVRDTGPGIAEADQSRIFEEFQQVDSANTRKKGGTGLGLAISRRIVELHGGSLSVESAVGAGSTFRVILPIDVRQGKEAA
jgi:signal transduction histidine kinase